MLIWYLETKINPNPAGRPGTAPLTLKVGAMARLKIMRTHEDAFKAYLAPEKYEVDDDEICVFCQLKHSKGLVGTDTCATDCAVDPACGAGMDTDDDYELVRYVLRYCKDWRVKNIQGLVRKKVKAMGY